jgi:hypothetical protein
MRISVVDPRELGMAELARWRALQEAGPSLDNPFLSPEFTRRGGPSWLRCSGTERLRDGGHRAGSIGHLETVRPKGLPELGNLAPDSVC